jgi:hypothetical protein
MTSRLDALIRPGPGEDYRSKSKQRGVGFALAFVGLMLAVVTLIANIAAANGDAADAPETLAWSFGLTTTAFAAIKFGIAVILIGILVRLFLRVQSVKESLPSLKSEGDGTVQTGTIDTPLGKATASATAPGPLPIHKMAKRLWAPMLAMGAMAVAVGLILSFAWAGDPGDTALAAWTQGLQFLGEGFLLAGIAFLLGTILASLREGGGAVQQSLGLTVKTPNMPTTAKAFVGLMMLGVMLAVLQFIFYLVVAGGVDTPAAWFAWLGPLRELSLGLILSGIVLALVTIGNVLGFQFGRIKEIIATGN